MLIQVDVLFLYEKLRSGKQERSCPEEQKSWGYTYNKKSLFYSMGHTGSISSRTDSGYGVCIKSSHEQSGFISILLLDHISIKESEMKAAGKTEAAPGRAQYA